MFIMKLNSEMFDKVKSGKKTYEVRLLDEKRQKIGIGDTIIFKREPDLIDGVVVKVVDAKVFPSFEHMAMTLSLASVGFENKDARQVARYYHKIYTKQDEAQYGVVAFRIELL